MLKEYIIAERDALNVMLEELDENYEEVITLLEKCKGKIVFMGIGKSGHIARKLSATFSSLGITSIFVHSSEAMHGDLGMLVKGDIAILISNSGNTQEVCQNIAPLRHNGIITVALTSGKDSQLVKECDYTLLYPHMQEADPLKLAPTVSSTLALVLGDAIACEIAARHKFTREQFYSFHPNGAIGESLKKECMRKN